MAKKIVKKVAPKAAPKVEVFTKNTKDLPVAEQSHKEYDPNLPLNKQRHLR